MRNRIQGLEGTRFTEVEESIARFRRRAAEMGEALLSQGHGVSIKVVKVGEVKEPGVPYEAVGLYVGPVRVTQLGLERASEN